MYPAVHSVIRGHRFVGLTVFYTVYGIYYSSSPLLIPRSQNRLKRVLVRNKAAQKHTTVYYSIPGWAIVIKWYSDPTMGHNTRYPPMVTQPYLCVPPVIQTDTSNYDNLKKITSSVGTHTCNGTRSTRFWEIVRLER